MKIDPRMKEELKKDLLRMMHEDEKKATITSAYPLGNDEITDIKKRFDIKEYTNNVDASILAGVVIQKGSKIIDLSLSSMLNNLENQVA